MWYLRASFIFLLLTTISTAFSIDNSVQQPDYILSTNLRGNYTNNMTNQQLQYVINAIASAERTYKATQYNEIAQSVSTSLSYVIRNPWAVLVFDKTTKDIGIAVVANQNKCVVLINTGNYSLSYILVMRGSSCIGNLNTNLANNFTQTHQQYSMISDPTKQLMRAACQSASTYAGDDVMKTAHYVAQKVSNVTGNLVEAIVSSPSKANGAYFCEYNNIYAKLINFADMHFNFYYFL